MKFSFVPGAFLALLFSLTCMAQVPKMGNDTLLDIACWNTEWFGDATSGNGPSDETLQFNNVKQVLNNTDIDVWSLEEISDATAWANLTAALPAYGNTIVSYSQTQKTALLWKKDKFDILSSGMVLNDASCNCYYDFASGRYPLEVVLKTKNVPVIDTIYFYVLHLKAYADQTSYGRRKNAAGFLKTFLDQNRAGKKTVVLGDWNDELNGSIVSGNPTPFEPILSDTAHYFFICKQLSDQGKKSYASSGGKMIDHIMISKPLKEMYVPASSKVLDMLPSYIPGYTSNTSDHYPVMGFFNLNRPPVVHTGEPVIGESVSGVSVFTYPNPSAGSFTVGVNSRVSSISMTDYLGRSVAFRWRELSNDELIMELEDASEGIYFLTVMTERGAAQEKIRVLR